MSSRKTISNDLVEFFASGVDLYVATRSAELVPESMLGMGIRVHPDRRTVSVYVPNVSAARTLENLADGTRAPIALTLCHPPTNRSVQLKGHCSAVRPSADSAREIQEIFRSAMIASFAFVGVPRALSRGLPWWPSTTLEVEVTDVFKQTPGPDAGEPLRGGSLNVAGQGAHD